MNVAVVEESVVAVDFLVGEAVFLPVLLLLLSLLLLLLLLQLHEVVDAVVAVVVVVPDGQPLVLSVFELLVLVVSRHLPNVEILFGQPLIGGRPRQILF